MSYGAQHPPSYPAQPALPRIAALNRQAIDRQQFPPYVIVPVIVPGMATQQNMADGPAPIAGNKRKRPEEDTNDQDKQALSFNAMSTQTVIILVGAEKKEFTVYIDLLCHVSPYFRNLFKGNFKESAAKSHTLNDVLVPVWIAFMEWMSSYRILVRMGVGNQTCRSLKTDPGDTIRLYKLADKSDIIHLRNDAVTRMWALFVDFNVKFNVDGVPKRREFLLTYVDMSMAFDGLSYT